MAGATGGPNPWRYAEEGERDAAGNEPARPFSVSGLIRESMGPGPSSCPCIGSSPSRSPHHGHDPSPDRIGQAVPDGGQLGKLGGCRCRVGNYGVNLLGIGVFLGETGIWQRIELELHYRI